jgi:hypothetical protein
MRAPSLAVANPVLLTIGFSAVRTVALRIEGAADCEAVHDTAPNDMEAATSRAVIFMRTPLVDERDGYPLRSAGRED